MEVLSEKRNITLDYYKIALSILVITAHVGELFGFGFKSWLIPNGIARITVPSFFIINGYFFYPKINNKKKTLLYLKHLIIIYITWSTLYLPYYYHEFNAEFIVIGYFHLWYVSSLIGGILFMIFLNKIVTNKKMILLTGILFFSIGYIHESIDIENANLFRAFTLAFPFVTIGCFIRQYKLEEKFKDSYLILIIAVSLCTLCIESYINHEIPILRNIFLSTLIFAPAAFIFVLKHSKYRRNNTFLSYIGGMSSAIYFVHVFVVMELNIFLGKPTIYKFPFIILISILLSIMIIFINKRIKIFL